MPILFGNLWKNADQFSFELQTKGFDPLQGELRLWWVIFRNVQNDLQINASTINKARYLTIQEWVILSKTYSNSKIYFETSVLDLIKQDVKATSKAFSAGEASNLEEKFLIGENINENVLNQGLVNFINKLDVHFNNLARISPMAKLLREYRNAIALIIPYYGANTDIIPPTFGVPPIWTNENGGIELQYDDAVFTLNAQNQLTILDRSGFKYEKPLNVKNINDVELLFSNPLHLDTHQHLTLNYNPNDFNLNTNNQLSLINKSTIKTVTDPLFLDGSILSFRYDHGGPFYVDPTSGFFEPRLAAPLIQVDNPEIHLTSIGLKLGTHLGVNADGSLDTIPYTAIEPLRITNNTEFSLGYEAPLFETAGQNLGIKIDGTTITLNEENQLQANTKSPAHPLYINESNDLALAFGSPLFMNPSNQLTLNYTPVFKLNTQQQLDLSIAKPLILDSNHDLTIDYSGGLWLSNNQLKINLATENSLTINNRNELVLNYNSSLYTNPNNNQLGVWFEGTFNSEGGVKFCRLAESEIDGPMGISVDTASGLEVNTNKGDYERIALSSTIKNQVFNNTRTTTQLTTSLRAEIKKITANKNAIDALIPKVDLNSQIRKRIKNINQITTTIYNRLTLLENDSDCFDSIYKQGKYRFLNKIQRGDIRNDTLIANIPNNIKIVNVKGTFFIQHNFNNYLFGVIKLDQLQDFSFSTRPRNTYYATYMGYFSTTMANPIYLRIYQQGNALKYYVYSADITSMQGYNIECDFQAITCDDQDFLRSTWNLISGNIYLINENWLYKLPNALKLVESETISISWVYQGHHFETAHFAVQFGTWVRLYLNNHDGPTWEIKLNNSDTFNLELVSGLDHALIQNLKLTKH